MKKKFFISALAFFTLLCVANCSYADENSNNQLNVQKQPYKQYKKLEKYKYHYSDAEKKQKRAEYEKRLNLTPEQKAQIEKNKEKDIEEIKPIYSQLKAKRAEIKKLKADTNLNDVDKQQKISEIKVQIKALRKQANDLRQENLKAFEALLDDNQKVEFAKIKEEQHLLMQQRKAERKRLKQGKVGLPVQPKPHLQEK